MLSRLLRQVLFFFLHLFITVLYTAKHVYHRFWVKKYKISKNATPNWDIKLILELVPMFSKKLKHIVMLANVDNHKMSDLANLVIWCLVAGIPYVSFYDTTGKLKENEEKLFLEVERKKKGIPGCIKWCNKVDLNGYSNGGQSYTVIVNIYTHKDGRAKIVECLNKLANNEILVQPKGSMFDSDEFNEALSYVYPNFPDPDLAIYTGDACITHGCLPWQIRLTEFIQISTEHSFNVVYFLDTLIKYNQCDQRFGK